MTDGHSLRGVPFGVNMGKRKGFIFTDKRNSNRALMAVILGIISLASLGIVIYASSQSGGTAKTGYGFTGLLALIYSIVGLVLGIRTAVREEYFRIIPILGIVLNAAALGEIGLILYMGGYLG